MVDGYTKIVLTVIAIALTALVFRPLITPRTSAAADTCGTKENPCFVAVPAGFGLPVVLIDSVGKVVVPPFPVRIVGAPEPPLMR